MYCVMAFNIMGNISMFTGTGSRCYTDTCRSEGVLTSVYFNMLIQ